MEEKILFWEFLFVISFAPAWNYLFKVSNLSTKLFNMKNVDVNDIQYERCQWRRSNAFIVNCNYISNFVPIVDFEQVNVCLVHNEKANIFKDKIAHIMRSKLF